MRRFLGGVAGLATVPLIALLTLSAAAQEAAQGRLNAVSFDPLPQDGAIFVRPLDNSDENLALKIEFERELAARGYVIATSADSLVLTFDTRDEAGAISQGDRRHVVELKQRVIGSRDPEDVSAQVKVFDSGSGALLNRGPRGSRVVTPSQYRLEVDIDDKRAGRRLWQGWAVVRAVQTDRRAINRAAIPILVDAIGQTVRSQPFDLP